MTAICFVCDGRFKVGEYPLEYRLKVSIRPGDQRKCHVQRIAHIPRETREQDVRFVQTFLERPGLSIEATAVLHEVLAMLEE